MSLPVDPTTAIQAAQLAGRAIGGAVGAVRSVVESSSFAEVLQGGDQTAAAESATDASDAPNFPTRFAQWLTSLGLPRGTSLQWSLGASGEVQLASDHPRAADLQLRLQEQPALRAELTRHISRQADQRWTVRLPN